MDPVLGWSVVAAAIVVVGWVLRPAGDAGAATTDWRVVALLSEREAALAALRDLDDDAALGRLAPDEYAALRADAIARGSRALAALDALAAAASGRASRLTEAVETDVSAARTPDVAAARTTDVAAARTTDVAAARTPDVVTARTTDVATARTPDVATARTTDDSAGRTTDVSAARTTDDVAGGDRGESSDTRSRGSS